MHHSGDSYSRHAKYHYAGSIWNISYFKKVCMTSACTLSSVLFINLSLSNIKKNPYYSCWWKINCVKSYVNECLLKIRII